MGKTITSILLIAAAVAVNVIPGAGQAISGAILSTIGTSFAAIGIVSTAVSIASFGLAIAGLGALESLFAPNVKPPTTESAVKQARPPRVSAYGQSRLYGAYVLYETGPNGEACDVFAYHDGQCDGFVRYYLGDDLVTLSGNVVQVGADGRYGHSKVEIYWRAGLPTETAYSEVIARFPGIWTEDHRGDGVVSAFVNFGSAKAKNFPEIYPSGTPPLSIVCRWQPCPDPRVDNWTDPATWTWTENAVRALLHYLIVRKGVDPATKITPTLQFWKDAADDCDIDVALKAFQTVLTVAADSGDATITVSATTGLSAGMTVSITASDDISHTETRTVSGIFGMVVSFSGGLDHDHPLGSAVNWASDPGSPATEARYRTCLTHQHTNAHKDVIAALLACFDGWYAPRADGALVVYSGRYYEPDSGDLIGPDEICSYSWDGVGVDDDKAVNEIICSYVSANHDFNTVETDAWTDEDDIAARGQVLSQPLDAQVPSWGQSRRLAKRKMARVNAIHRGTVTTTVAGRKIRGKRYIPLLIEEAGATFYDGPAEITALTRNMSTGGVTFTWIAADPNVDNWDPAAEEGNPAAKGNRVAPQPLDAPTIDSAAIATGLDSATDAGGARIVLMVTGPDRDDLTWIAHWRVQGASVWGSDATYSDVDPGPSVELHTDFVPVDQTLEVQVAYQVGDGRVSDWSSTATVDSTISRITTEGSDSVATEGGDHIIEE